MPRPKRTLYQAYTGTLPDSSLRYILEALLPYSRANIMLAYKPNSFFNDLEKISNKYSRSTLRSSYYRAIKDGYIVVSPSRQPTLSPTGHAALEPYQPVKLSGAYIVVIFDIPEQYARQRARFRTLLRELDFVPVQKSVWESTYDSRAILTQAMRELRITPYVKLYEAVAI